MPGLELPRMKSRIMYIEARPDGLSGPARIGRVTFSKSGATLQYRGRSFRSLKGGGHTSNYFEVESGDRYWISAPRKDGQDRLYPGGAPVEIDDEVREEYWSTIRAQPDRKHEPHA